MSHNRCQPLAMQQQADNQQIQTIVHWQYQRGGEAHCLAQIYVQPHKARAIALISESRSNEEGLGIAVTSVVSRMPLWNA